MRNFNRFIPGEEVGERLPVTTLAVGVVLLAALAGWSGSGSSGRRAVRLSPR